MGIWLDGADFPGLDADEAIDELEARLSLTLPCLLTLPDVEVDRLRMLLKPIVRRWVAVGVGIGGRTVTGPFQDDSPVGARALQHQELSALRALCGDGVGGLPAGSFPAGEPIDDLFAHRPSRCWV